MGMMAIPNLTEAQQNQIDDLRAGQVKEVAGIRTDIEIKQLELARLWRADKLDGGKIVAKVKELGELRSKMQVTQVNQHLAVYKLLTPEQQKSFRPPMMGGMGHGQGQGKGTGRGMGKAGAGGGKVGGEGRCGGDCGGCH
jgi:Spy/CpxP family protein refolding chaperone